MVLLGDDLEVVEHLHSAGPAMAVDIADDQVGAALAPAPRLTEHGVGLADPGCGAEVDAQCAPSWHLLVRHQ